MPIAIMGQRLTPEEKKMEAAIQNMAPGSSLDFATELNARSLGAKFLHTVKGTDGKVRWFRFKTIPGGVRVTLRA